ncbi:exosortase-dependent surface protein XDP1 [Neptunomonas antarctica]|uniref:PEP-CTERM protein-sorting domain-containing protein n=1 Tax=Neptunomonas antarctica TaxID=619304 RepID=A0A1N7P3H6_9GAMM|nr:exosortase-dependent surface protein XDP1 [Neptunomonas antarctica]SIT05153.1 PEP-CTERM protein-sorting domain-containing protein [Neptunomonas antarctica]
MKFTGLKIGLCTLLAVTSIAANASVSWDFTSNRTNSVSGSTSGTYQFTGNDSGSPATPITTLSAWSAPVTGRNANQITNIDNTLSHNSYGLIIDQRNDNSHTIDNADNYEFVMFDFGAKEFSLDAFDIGWNRNNPWSDVTVMAYQGGTPTSQPANSIAGASLTGLSADGWSVISHNKNVGTGPIAVNSDLASVYSSYWIIGAYMSAVGTGTNTGDTINDTNWDGIKLAGITGTIKQTTSLTNDVPEPGTLLLTALGLAFIARKKIAAKR